MPVRRIRPAAALAATALWAALGAPAAQAACYIVYDASREVVYRGQTPPVNMAYQLHETLPLLVPGGTMVFSLDSSGCELELNRLPAAGAAPLALAPGVRRAPRAPRG